MGINNLKNITIIVGESDEIRKRLLSRYSVHCCRNEIIDTESLDDKDYGEISSFTKKVSGLRVLSNYLFLTDEMCNVPLELEKIAGKIVFFKDDGKVIECNRIIGTNNSFRVTLAPESIV